MSTATEISRLQTARNTIRNKLITFGLAESADKLDTLATAIDGISYQGAISATVQEGDTYTIPQGYHNGSGTVSGIAGGGNYTLQTKGPITPTKNQINVAPDNGYYGLSAVTIDPIPEAYQDVTAVTATASQVLATKIFVTSDGTITTGTMPNNGAVSQTLSATSTSYTVPSGYHTGSGIVKIVTETKSATPSTASQDITPTSGKVLSKVTVNAIPSDFKNITGVTAAPTQVLAGTSFVNSTGLVAGTMPNIGAVSAALDTATTSYTIPSGYHNGSGTVSIVTETKSATPSTASQDITPTSGKVLSKVTVNRITPNYANTYGDTAYAGGLLSGLKAHSYRGDIDEAYQITGTMPNIGTVSVALDTATTSYTIPSGYHNGSGTVSIVLEDEYVTPIADTVVITPTSGKVLNSVTIFPIPPEYPDVTGDDAIAANILYGKKAHSYDAIGQEGVALVGTMPNNGAVSSTLSTTSTSYTIPSGYHNGSGTVSLVTETKSATPSTASQDITPTSGKVLSKVTVAAIPSKYGDTTGDDAVAANILSGKKAHSISNGGAVALTGSMTNNGAIAGTIDGLTTLSYTVPAGYHNGSGTVSLTSDIETALASI